MLISFLIRKGFRVHRTLCVTTYSFFTSIGAVLLAVSLTAVSCTKETADESCGLFVSKKTCNVLVTLKTGLDNEVDVKGYNSWHLRTDISNVWVIQLSENGERQLCEPKYVTSFKPMGGGYTFEARLIEANAMVIFLANTSDPTLVPATGNTLASIQSLTKPMGSLVTNGYIASFAKWSGQVSRLSLITATLTRTSALLDLTIDTQDLPAEYTVTMNEILVDQMPMQVPYLFPENVTNYPGATASFGRIVGLSGSITQDLTKKTWSKHVDLSPNVRGKGSATNPTQKNAATCPAGEANRCGRLCVRFVLATKDGNFTETDRVTVYLGQNATNDFNIYPGDILKLTLKIKGFKKNDVRITASNRNTIYKDYPLRWSRVDDQPRLKYNCRDQKPAIVAQIYFKTKAISNQIKLIYKNAREVEGSEGIQTPRYEYIRPVLRLTELMANPGTWNEATPEWGAADDNERDFCVHINNAYYLAGERLEAMYKKHGWTQCGGIEIYTNTRNASTGGEEKPASNLAISCCRKDHCHDGYYTQMKEIGKVPGGYVVDNATGNPRPWGFNSHDIGISMITVPTIE